MMHQTQYFQIFSLITTIVLDHQTLTGTFTGSH